MTRIVSFPSRSVCSRVRFGAHSVPLTVPVSDGTSPAGRVEWGREGKERNERCKTGPFPPHAVRFLYSGPSLTRPSVLRTLGREPGSPRLTRYARYAFGAPPGGTEGEGEERRRETNVARMSRVPPFTVHFVHPFLSLHSATGSAPAFGRRNGRGT